MSGPISIVFADDHALVRETLGTWLADATDLHVAASVSNAEDAVEAAIQHQPGIVMLDVDMPGLECFEAARRIKARCPDTRIMFLSAFFHDRYIEQALAVEASGYITKTEPPESVLRGIRQVASGVAYFSPEVESRIVITSGGVKLASKARSRMSTLTPQQLRILRYLAQGLSKKEIASSLSLSEKTIARHSDNLMAKLDIHDRVELARFAIREGIVEP